MDDIYPVNKKTMKHTKGKWEINPIFSNEGIEIHNTVTTIAHVQSFRNPFNETEMQANAKLIVSAPELLEALRQTTGDLLSLQVMGYPVDFDNIERATKAIKKATS